MKHAFTALTAFLFVPTFALALTYDDSNLPYTDSPRSDAEGIAVSVLTTEEVLTGNPDGTFRFSNRLNRAEFTVIAMRMLDEPTPKAAKQCFYDVPFRVWYTDAVCYAKDLGIVQGRDPVDGGEPYFDPDSEVQYDEALKILVELFEVPYPVIDDAPWYLPYFVGAEDAGLLLSEDRGPDYKLRRGDMARLAVAFLADSHDEIEELRSAEAGEPAVNEDTETEDAGSLITDDDLELPPTDDTEGDIELDDDLVDPEADNKTYDPLPVDDVVEPNILLLGETSPVMGSAQVLSEAQPLVVEKIIVRLVGESTSIDRFIIYDEEGALLGSAFRDGSFPGNRQYALDIADGELVMPKEESFSFYVRAVLSAHDAGGDSGQIVQIERIGVEGYGEWNNKDQSDYTSETYPVHQTARSTIVSVDNPASDTDVLIAGPQVRLGTFKFTGNRSDSSADIEVLDIHATLSQAGVTVGNIKLGVDSTSEKFDCTLASSRISCTSLPASFGDLSSHARTYTFYGDVAILSAVSNPSLQLRINEPGSATSAGDIRWTDGDITFTWVDEDYPVASSSVFK